MSTRINLDTKVYGTNAFMELVIASGSRKAAKAHYVEMLELADQHYFPNRKPIPLEEWRSYELPDALLGPKGFADIVDGGVMVKDAPERFKWKFQKSKAGSAKKKTSTQDSEESPPDQPLSADDQPITADNTRSTADNVRQPTSYSLLPNSYSLLSAGLLPTGGSPAPNNVVLPFSHPDVIALVHHRRNLHLQAYEQLPLEDTTTTAALALLLSRIGGSRDEAERVLSSYYGTKKPFYAERRHGLKWLHQDLDEHLSKARPGGPSSVSTNASVMQQLDALYAGGGH